MSAEKQMTKKKLSVKPEHILLAVIILAQFIVTFWMFSTYKELHFTDEYYSYGISNSFERPFLHSYVPFLDDDNSYETKFQWLTGDEFKYYLRTKPETAFRYDSVWHNSAKDTMPPLYYTILHTLCSFNAGHFSWYDAFAINLVCLVITQIFVYLLAAEVTRSKRAALLTTAFWEVTLGGISCFTFLRMYAMLVMFCMIFAWLTVRVHTAEKLRWSDAVWVCVVTFLGAMTHHNFLVFAFFCALFSCLFLLCRRAFRKLFTYGFSVVGGVLLSVAVFPATIRQMGYQVDWTVPPDLWANAPLFQAVIKLGLTGTTMLKRDLYASVIAVLASVILLSIPVLFLFRDKPLVKRLLAFLKALPKRIWQHLSDPQKMHPGAMILLLTTYGYFLVIAGMTSFWDLQVDGIRYFYMLLPILVMLTVGFAALLLRRRKPMIRNAASVVCLLGMAGLLVFQYRNEKPPFLSKAQKDNAITEIGAEMQGSDCIVLFSHLLVNEQCLSELLENADQVLIARYSPAFLRNELYLTEMQKIFDQHQTFYLVLDRNGMIPDDYDPETVPDSDGMQINMMDQNYFDSMKRYDELLVEAHVVEYFESLSGCSAVCCGNAITLNLDTVVYRFTPSES